MTADSVDFWFRDPFQPYLAPIGVKSPRTKHPFRTVAGLAYHRLQYDTRILHPNHFSRLFVDNFFDPFFYLISTLAVRNHLGIPTQPAVPTFNVERLEYFRT